MKFWAICLVILALAIYGSFVLKVSHIGCQTQYGPCPQVYLTSANKFLGRPLYHPFSFPKPVQLFQTYPEIKNVTLSRVFPQTLTLHIELYEPLGQIASASSAIRWLVDDTGVIFASSSSSLLPLLISTSSASLRQTISPRDLTALRFLDHLLPLSSTQPVGTLANNDITSVINSSLQVIANLNHLPDGWEIALQSLLTRSKITGHTPKIIDLRFANPIVTY